MSRMSSLYIQDINPFLDIQFTNIFSHSVDHLLILLIVSFAVHKLFNSTYSFFINFCFCCLAFGFIYKKSLSGLISENFFPNVFFQEFMASCLTIKSLICFKLIFVNGVRQGSSFILLHVQFSSVTQSCLTLCDPMNRSTPGLPVHHQLPEFTQTHVH